MALSFLLRITPWNRRPANPVRPSGPASPQGDSRLLSLPVETRTYIYELLFSLSDSGLVIRFCNKPQHNHPPSVLSILQTCRQVLYEAEEIFYAINRFRYVPSLSPKFLRGIGPTRRNAITSMTLVAESGAYAHRILPQLTQVPNLSSLYIERILSVRFLNISEWAVMAEQIRRVLVQMEHLQEVKMITPHAENLLDWEEERRVKLESVDAKLHNFRDVPTAFRRYERTMLERLDCAGSELLGCGGRCNGDSCISATRFVQNFTQ